MLEEAVVKSLVAADTSDSRDGVLVLDEASSRFGSARIELWRGWRKYWAVGQLADDVSPAIGVSSSGCEEIRSSERWVFRRSTSLGDDVSSSREECASMSVS
jgi:hypothetical protein